MEKRKVSIFKPYSFYEGQKIHIDGGPRNGDWEVVSFTKRKVKLRCPISLKEFEWSRFCYQVEERDAAVWPQEE